MAYKIRVKNTSDRVVERLGHEFLPGKEVEVVVHSRRDLLTIKAPVALEVEVEEVKEKATSRKSEDVEKAPARKKG
ncbi:hypothetical protein GCM10007416_00690 [Kroppenstedtia guangzhouensis]|uniref:Uncharacterized protein n=1 Tax=Kroppenstedtia guangzhouensis TaxID=1274356 RepID=A0ABQ1FVL2_9BACL|nr:hypothetical protein [Kroppenstedtia guangzhouensis]GGA31996.1 hypothetical protein GCM10007416_00690 [Kroppenstedtia guangzhouensis]